MTLRVDIVIDKVAIPSDIYDYILTLPRSENTIDATKKRDSILEM
jgi:hypothetical protein